MKSLIIANIKQRPTRTAVSVLGVALGIVLIIIFAGLVNGMQRDRSRRESNVGAEIMFRREFSLTAAAVMILPIQYASKLSEIPGVSLVSPVAQYLKPSNTGIGFEILEGIDYPSYSQMAGLQLVNGSPLKNYNDVLIDEHYAHDKKVTVGSFIDLFNRKFQVCGIYQPESGARIKINLSTMQDLMKSPDRCTLIYVKCSNPEDQEIIIKQIDNALPGNKLLLVRDLKQLYENGIPAFNTFLKLVIGVAVVISLLVILLAMYTTIVERTREIGILKSLGASKSTILAAIEGEAFLICVLGIIVGYLAAIILQFGISKYTSLLVEIELRWIFYAAAIGIFSGLLGALYPALRAANSDPIAALSYE